MDNNVLSKRNKSRILLIDSVLFVIFLFFDQLTKYMAVGRLKEHPPFIILDGILEFQYLENHGSAFGLFQNQKIFILLISGTFMLLLVFVLFRLPGTKKYLPLDILVTLILSGGIGNMIDRVIHDYVIDFIYFKIINYPIFNVADIYVVVGTILIAILCLFIYEEKDLDFLSFKGGKQEDK